MNALQKLLFFDLSDLSMSLIEMQYFNVHRAQALLSMNALSAHAKSLIRWAPKRSSMIFTHIIQAPDVSLAATLQ